MRKTTMPDIYTEHQPNAQAIQFITVEDQDTGQTKWKYAEPTLVACLECAEFTISEEMHENRISMDSTDPHRIVAILMRYVFINPKECGSYLAIDTSQYADTTIHDISDPNN